MAVISNKIVIPDVGLTFENVDISAVSSDSSVSLVGEELYIDQFSATVNYFVYIPYVIKPADVEVGPFSGQTVTFQSDKEGTVSDFKVRIIPTQSGSGTPSPSNIRPLLGWYSMNVSANGDSKNISWEARVGMVYGGLLDLLRGELEVYPYYQQYNGESLIGPWISSMDEYEEGELPTVGAQVVDFGGIPEVYQITTEDFDVVIGANSFSADTGSVLSLTYSIDEYSYDGFMSSDGYILCSKENFDLRTLPYGTKMYYYVNNHIAAIYYAKTVERTGKSWYVINAMSAIGLMDRQYHVGGVYQGAYLHNVIEEIIGDGYDYIIDGLVSTKTVYGWLPYATKRANLYQVLLAYGIELVVGANGSLFFTLPEVTLADPIPSERVYSGGKVIYNEPASRVEIYEHSFHKDSAVEEVVLFDNSQDAAADEVTVIFEQPIDKETLRVDSGNLEISKSDTNYAIVSGNGVLVGKPWVHNIRVISQDNENVGVEKIVSVQQATLITFINADSVLSRLSEYYFNANTVEQDIILEREKTGNYYRTKNSFDEDITGYLVSMKKTVSSFTRATCKFITNYVPKGSGQSYENRVLIPLGPGARETWTIPEIVFTKEIPNIRITLIGKGHDGMDGEDGEVGGGSVDRAAKGGNGGAGGEGGDGGDVLTVSILATGLTEITLANSGDDSILESEFYNFTSADGAPQEFGYFDILTGEVFARPGTRGVNGGSGGTGDVYKHTTKAGTEETATNGEGVVYDGVYYDGGMCSSRQRSNGRPVFPSSEYSGNLTISAGAAGGGGAAAGNIGGDAYNDSNPLWADGVWGTGGNGSDAVDPSEAPDVYGVGGNGGHGGGGGGASGNLEAWNHAYSALIVNRAQEPGAGGKGSKGGVGRYGCAIIYY